MDISKERTTKNNREKTIACITFNEAWNKATKTVPAGHNNVFHTFIYPRSTNSSYLNLLCIDERNAIQSQNDRSSILIRNHNYWRWYDLVEPW